MKHLKRFENFDNSTEKESEDFMNQFGEDSDSANTIGQGIPCGECNCVVEECNCGCQSCKDKQDHGQTYKREPYKQDYSLQDREAISEKKKEKTDISKKSEKIKKEDKNTKPLTAKQKKLPEGLRRAIEAKNRKKK